MPENRLLCGYWKGNVSSTHCCYVNTKISPDEKKMSRCRRKVSSPPLLISRFPQVPVSLPPQNTWNSPPFKTFSLWMALVKESLLSSCNSILACIVKSWKVLCSLILSQELVPGPGNETLDSILAPVTHGGFSARQGSLYVNGTPYWDQVFCQSWALPGRHQKQLDLLPQHLESIWEAAAYHQGGVCRGSLKWKGVGSGQSRLVSPNPYTKFRILWGLIPYC